MPVWTEDSGKVMTQSAAILRYLGAKYGFYPEELYERYECDAVMDMLYGDFVTGEIYRRFFKEELSSEDITDQV